MNLKRFFACVAITCFFAIAVSAQRDATTVEQQYLTAVEDVVILELANSDTRDNKLVALQYIEDSINKGRKTAEMTVALSGLGGEGTYNSARMNNRIINDFPDVRIKASELLGQMGTAEAKDALVRIVRTDTEPSVIAAAIRSAGDIGIVENDDVLSVIIECQRKFSILNPSSSLALEVLNAFEKLSPKIKDKASMVRVTSEIATNYKYVAPVRARAQDILQKLSQQ